MSCGTNEFDISWMWLAVVIGLFLLIGVTDTTAVLIMTFRMPIYVEFLLYFPTIIYTAVFVVAALALRQRFRLSCRENLWMLALGLATAVNGILAQFAVPHVAPELSNILVQISLPTTWMLSWLIFRWRLNVWRCMCFGLIIGSLLLAVLPSAFYGDSGGGKVQSSPAVWVIITLLSALPTAVQTVAAEYVIKTHKTPILTMLAYYNGWSLLFYFLSLPVQMTHFQMGKPLTWDEIWSNQKHAFMCFLGHGGHLGDCMDGATFWTLTFSFCYSALYILQAMLLRVRDASTVGNLMALFVPGAAVAMWCRFIVGEDAENPVWWIAVSVILLSVGNTLYERYSKEKDEDVPEDWIGRHVVRNQIFNFTVIKARTAQDPESELLINKT